MDYSLARLNDWVQFVDERGIIGTSRAGGWRVAINRILSDVSPAEAEDVRKIDLDSAMRRFINRNPHDLMPSSLAEYHRRIRIAIQEFTAWQDKLYSSHSRVENGA